MARTAPVPNIPPIPGMCPSIAVMGGGGDGGGGSGSGAGDGDGSGPADGSGAGDGANGDGSGAGSCGPGSGSACSNPAHGGSGGAVAGDPVDVLTGRVFTSPSLDLMLPGPLPLLFERSYSTTARKRDIGFGFGWSHSLAWEVRVHRERVTVWKPDGRRDRFDSLPVGQEGRTPSFVVRRDENGFTVLDGRGIARHMVELDKGSGVYVLVAIVNGYGSTIQLQYDASARLASVTDAVGRSIRLVRSPDGHIARLEVMNAVAQGKWVLFHEYVYDDASDLVSSIDANGAARRYTYDRHLLTSDRAPTNRTTHYVYDASHRCVETWVDYPGAVDSSLDATVPKLLADGTTKAKGVLHVRIERNGDDVTMIESRSVRRFVKNEFGKFDKAIFGGGVATNRYSALGHLTQHQDASGAVWQWQFDGWGRLHTTSDPNGSITRYVYDATGRLRQRVEPNGRSVDFTRNAQGDVLLFADDMGPILQMARDARGLVTHATMPNGGNTFMEYDAHGNRVRIREPNGAVRVLKYDFFGNVIAVTEDGGIETRFRWDLKRNLLEVQQADGGRLGFVYDGLDRAVTLVNQRGDRWQIGYSGFNSVVSVARPNGAVVSYRFDREGDLVRVINGNGEEHLILRNALGQVQEERTFDGRTVVFKQDKLGRITSIKRASGKLVKFSYDPVGNMTERNFNDEIVETFSYDTMGRMVSASDGVVRSLFSYNSRGELVEQLIEAFGQTHAVRAEYDELGHRASARMSWGFEGTARFDKMGDCIGLGLSAWSPSGSDPGRPVDIEMQRNLDRLEVRRLLPGGGALESNYDVMGRYSERWVTTAGSVRADASEPDRLNARGGGWHEQLSYDDVGQLALTRDTIRGARELRYDPVGQLISQLPERVQGEVFSYDAAGNLFDGVTREYESGGLLKRLGNNELEYDADHQLIRRTVDDDTGKHTTRYGWDARGKLKTVDLPDKTRITYVHDMFARRLRATVTKNGKVLEREDWHWDNDLLSQTVRRSATASGDPIIEERTYAYAPLTMTPIAHRVTETKQGVSTTKPWAYYVVESSLRPQLLVDGGGQPLASYSGRAWGQAQTSQTASESTPLRFAGHFEDARTGLFYNRHRMYDPASGRYLSPEPIGLEGGLSPFGYAKNNPIEWIDPNGLAGMISTATDGTVTGTGTAVGRNGRGARRQGTLNPIVQDALLARGDSLEGARNGSRHPASCAEPQAISNFLDERGIDENSSDAEISQALSEMQLRTTENDGTTERAPCQNCSQMLANLHARFGAPTASQITPGRPTHAGGTPTHFTPPSRPTRADGTPNHTSLP